jgi:hypothetical protein
MPNKFPTKNINKYKTTIFKTEIEIIFELKFIGKNANPINNSKTLILDLILTLKAFSIKAIIIENNTKIFKVVKFFLP